MRPWWQDVLIQATGSVLAAGAVALTAVLLGVLGSPSLQAWTRVGTTVLLALLLVLTIVGSALFLVLGIPRGNEDSSSR